jgi:hypothetical protein
MQIETSKRHLRIISGNSNRSPYKNLPSQVCEEFPEAEQEKSWDSVGLEENQNSGSGSQDDGEKSPGGVKVGES